MFLGSYNNKKGTLLNQVRTEVLMITSDMDIFGNSTNREFFAQDMYR